MRAIALLLFFAALFFRLTPPVGDPDFWWHLASGRSMAEQRSLPAADPFVPPAFAAEAAAAEPFASTQSWLAQLIFHGVHARGGLTGVVLLRAALFTLLWALLYRLMRRSRAPAPLAALLVWLSAEAVAGELGYVGDRPQMWSSLLLVALVSLLERMREGSTRAHLALPPLMLLWANLHGGFILGDLVLLPYLAAALRRGDRRFALACGVALLASGCNPNGWAIASSYLSVRLARSSALLIAAEEQSLLSHAGLAGIPRLMPHLAALAALGGAALLANLRPLARRRPELLALALLLVALGGAGIRFLVFALTLGAWLTALNLREAAARLDLAGRLRLPPRLARAAPAALALGVLLLGAAQWARAGLRASALLPGRAAPHPYAAAADHLAASGARGTIFNEFDAGGYLAWRLFPACRVFVHGGLPSPSAIALFRSVIDAPLTPVPPRPGGGDGVLYRRELRDRGIDLVVIPGVDPVSGTLIQLAAALAQDAEWALVHVDPRALAFERITAANGSRILRTMRPAEAAYDQMAGIARQVARTRHGRSFPAWRYSLAYALYGLGLKEEALPLLEEYLRLVPGDAASRAVRDRIVQELRGD